MDTLGIMRLGVWTKLALYASIRVKVNQLYSCLALYLIYSDFPPFPRTPNYSPPITHPSLIIMSTCLQLSSSFTSSSHPFCKLLLLFPPVSLQLNSIQMDFFFKQNTNTNAKAKNIIETDVVINPNIDSQKKYNLESRSWLCVALALRAWQYVLRWCFWLLY